MIVEFYFEYNDESYKSDLKHNKAMGALGLFAVILHHLQCMNPVTGNTLYLLIGARIFFHQQYHITS